MEVMRPVIGGITAVLLLLCAGSGPVSAGNQPGAIAVFPAENLSGTSAPLAEVRQHLAGRLKAAGVGVLDEGALEAFLTRRRIRYTAGIDGQTAEALKRETGAEAALFVSVELSSELVPPKIALTARLVSTEDPPAVAWADDVGMSGDDAPGWLSLGLVNDHQALLTTALDRLAESLLAHLQTGTRAPAPDGAGKFKPKSFTRKLNLGAGPPRAVAVVPFVNVSSRRRAGEVLALLFARHLAALPQFRVAEVGVTRQQLLDARIIMEGGLSLADAETVAALVDAEFVLGGRVIRYDDYEGAESAPSVEFSTVLIERKTRRVVWESTSYNAGNDGISFFGRGRSRTAHAMATRMVGHTAAMMAGLDR